jgi:hypothetical protein
MTNQAQTHSTEIATPPPAFNEHDFNRFTVIMAANSVPPEDVQALLELAAAVSKRGGETAMEALTKNIEDIRELWRTAVFNDPKLGGENSSAAKADADLAIALFGSPELNSVLDSGCGDHPEMVRFCANVGKAFREAAAARDPEKLNGDDNHA